jgi:hypothetical protein
MFEDLIPSASAQTPAPPPGPFDDLIPAAAAAGRAGSMIAQPPARAEPRASIGSVLKQLAIGVPEGVLGMAGAASDVMSGNFLTRPIVSALAGDKLADVLVPSHGKLLHEALPSVLNPENYPARNFPERIARGVGEALPAVAIPGGSLASRLLTQGLAGGTGAVAAEVAPEPYKPAAQLAGNLIGAGAATLRFARTAKPRTGAEPSPTAEDTAFEKPSAPESPSDQQIAENRATIADAVRDVGVPPERIDPADIDGLARSVTRRDLLNFEAFKRGVIDDALKRGLITPEEAEQIYGKGVADEYRGTSTPANGAVAPSQGARGGEPGRLPPEGQQLPGPGENGGEARGPATAGPETPQSVAPEARGVEPGVGEQGQPAEPAPSSARERTVPDDAVRPEETARPDEVTSKSEPTASGEADQSPKAEEQQSPERRPDEPPGPPQVAARLTGDELGPATDLKQLQVLAKQYGFQKLRGRVIVNRETGQAIEINRTGLKKSISGNRGSDLLRILPAIPEMLEHGRRIATVPETGKRHGIRATHIFESAAELGGKRLDTVLFVRERNDGSFFYDYGIKRGDTGIPGPGR